MDAAGNVRSNRRLGQVFLINEGVAYAEAAHAHGKVVIEIGPGPGMLTQFLCQNAKKVIAVEKDLRLYTILKHEMHEDNLVLINKDFLDATDRELELENADILISNIPYNLSSSVIGWLAEKRMQAVLCLQKEFVDHMLARPNTKDYSKLSVITSLLFRVTRIMHVSRGSFRPIPKVDSEVVYIKPLGASITDRQLYLIGLIMQHKKKTLRNAIIDSHSGLGIDKDRCGELAARLDGNERRVFKMDPQEILEASRKLEKLLE
jgi:16S rRNA (adenine1518-N6/adenine1519-N6)-dimethyltransferase